MSDEPTRRDSDRGIIGRGSIFADEAWRNDKFAVIGVVVAVVAFLAACIRRNGRLNGANHFRSGSHKVRFGANAAAC